MRSGKSEKTKTTEGMGIKTREQSISRYLLIAGILPLVWLVYKIETIANKTPSEIHYVGGLTVISFLYLLISGTTYLFYRTKRQGFVSAGYALTALVFLLKTNMSGYLIGVLCVIIFSLSNWKKFKSSFLLGLLLSFWVGIVVEGYIGGGQTSFSKFNYMLSIESTKKVFDYWWLLLAVGATFYAKAENVTFQIKNGKKDEKSEKKEEVKEVTKKDSDKKPPRDDDFFSKDKGGVRKKIRKWINK